MMHGQKKNIKFTCCVHLIRSSVILRAGTDFIAEGSSFTFCFIHGTVFEM